MRKKMFVMFAMLLLLFSTFPVNAASTRFIDVKQNSWYYKHVESVVEKGLFQGESAIKFSPEATMTRAMFAQVLANLTTNYETPGKDEISYFTDVSKNAWYYAPVQWAAKHGLVNGVGDAKFKPNDKITRQEMVTMLFRYALRTGEVTKSWYDALYPFTDNEDISKWARDAFRWAAYNQIIHGKGNNILAPKADASRAEVATMFDNAYDKLKSKEIPAVLQELPPDPDIDFLQAFHMTLDELNQGVAIEPENPNPDEGIRYNYKGLSLFPGLRTFYMTKPTANQGMPDFLHMPLDKVFPELLGKTAGEAMRLLGPSAHLQEGDSVIPLLLVYETESYYFTMECGKESLGIQTEYGVYVNFRRDPAPVAMPADRTFFLHFDDVQLATLTLPESWKNCVVEKNIGEYAKKAPTLYFSEPVQALRYPQVSSGMMFSLVVVDESTVSTNGIEKYMNVTLDGKEYSIILMLEGKAYTGDDKEAGASDKIMRGEAEAIFDSIKLLKGVKRG